MEYLLREKLERLVQSEIESRLLAYRRDGKESSLLTVRLCRMRMDVTGDGCALAMDILAMDVY
jgi:hypothetical protein